MRRLKVSEPKSIVLRVSLKTLMVPLVQYLFYPNTTASMQYARKFRYIPFFAINLQLGHWSLALPSAST